MSQQHLRSYFGSSSVTSAAMRPHKQARSDGVNAGSPSASFFARFACCEDADALQECAESILEDLDASHSLLSGMFKTFLQEANIRPAVRPHSSKGSHYYSATQAKRPRDTEMPLRVTLEELYNGAMKSVPVQRRRSDGLGRVVPVQEQLQVCVEPGLKEGTRITLPGQGNEDPYGMSADLTFIVHQQLHPDFRRLKDDLYAIVNVPLVTALTGGPVSLRTLSGQLLQLPVSDIITPGSELVLPNYGMPVYGDQQGRKGALHVRFNVKFPEQLSHQQQMQLKLALAGCEEFTAGKPAAVPAATHQQREICHQQHTTHQVAQRQQFVHSELQHDKQRCQQQYCTAIGAYSQTAARTAYAGKAPGGSNSMCYAAAGSSAACSSSIAGFACTQSTSSSRQHS